MVQFLPRFDRGLAGTNWWCWGIVRADRFISTIFPPSIIRSKCWRSRKSSAVWKNDAILPDVRSSKGAAKVGARGPEDGRGVFERGNFRKERCPFPKNRTVISLRPVARCGNSQCTVNEFLGRARWLESIGFQAWSRSILKSCPSPPSRSLIAEVGYLSRWKVTGKWRELTTWACLNLLIDKMKMLPKVEETFRSSRMRRASQQSCQEVNHVRSCISSTRDDPFNRRGLSEEPCSSIWNDAQ